MAYKFFRWVGSGNTGATSINIFNWNHPGNWEILKYTGPGASGGWRYVGTTFCPGPFDTAAFGHVYMTPGENGGVSVQNFLTLSKVKSPCLFGGFSGNVAAGSWAGSGLCGSASGITYTSALQRFVINNTLIGGHPDSPNFGRFKSYNDTLYDFNNPDGQGIPFGGGVTPSLASFNNLQWIKNNYPNMGIVAGFSSGSFDYEFSVPGYTTNAGMDDVTIKCYGDIVIQQRGSCGASPMALKCVGAYVPFSRNFGVTGYTGANAPEVITRITGQTPQEFIVDGGLFNSIELFPAPRKVATNGALGLPYIKFTGNMTVLEFMISCANETVVDKTVKFKDMVIYNVIDLGNQPDYSVIDKTLAPDGLNRGATVRGSQYVTDVFNTLYPGNTGINVFDIGRIEFSNYFGSFADGYGIKRNFTEAGISRMHEVYSTLKRNAATRCLGESDSNSATQDLRTFFPEDLQTFQNAAAPGTHFLKIGGIDYETGQTYAQNIEHIYVACNRPGLETTLVRVQGEVKINEIRCEGGNVDFFGHQGTARIANFKMDEKSCLDLRNPLYSDSQIYFGLVSSSGVCGGISNLLDSASSLDSGGNIFLERGERLFNVSTSKGGRITTVASAEEVSVSDSLPPSVAKKGS